MTILQMYLLHIDDYKYSALQINTLEVRITDPFGISEGIFIFYCISLLTFYLNILGKSLMKCVWNPTTTQY